MRLKLAIDGVKVGRWVIVVVHTDYDSEKNAERGHGRSGSILSLFLFPFCYTSSQEKPLQAA